MAKYTVAVAGATGYAGGEALRILAAHPNFEVTCVAGHSSVGDKLGKHMPHIPQLADLVVEDTTPEVLNGHDVIILALPHGASGALASQLDPNAVVVDLGADHRLEEKSAWDAFYGGDFYQHWTYGMPELITGVAADGSYSRQREALPGTKRIAGPGCNVTATTLALQPGIAQGLVESKDIVADLVVGYSGAGKNLKRTNLLAAEAFGSALPYSVGGTHRHIPEILQNFAHAAGKSAAEADDYTLAFTPILAPMARGILATVSAKLTDKALGMTDAEIRQVWLDAYEGQDFMVVLPEGVMPATANIIGSNAAHIQVVVDHHAGRLLAFAAIDNLNRGTAGQAVQSLNVALGLPEDAGLTKIEWHRERNVLVSAAGVAAGISAVEGKKDLALVVNNGPLDAAAGVFTSNRFCAAPVQWSRNIVSDGHVKAVILNSGGANACTGKPGYEQSKATAEKVASLIGAKAEDVAVCSNGLIGELLPLDNVLSGADKAFETLADTAEAGADASHAIMTTDTKPKTVELEGSNGFRIGGMVKGSGMIAPQLATMLCVITTDAVVTAGQLQAALNAGVEMSFNRIDVDGCMSTNDTVLLLASGASGIEPDPDEFNELVAKATASLARQIIGDGEGASHDIRVKVTGATTEEAALACGRAVAASNLLKCAISGNDPNWGRIVSSLGTVPPDVAPYDSEKVTVDVNGVRICENGGAGRDRSEVDMTPREVHIDIDLNAGEAEATVWTDDLTHEYVHINADYES